MVFDREEFKKRSKEGISTKKKARKKTGDYVSETKLRIAKTELEESEIKRITVRDIEDEIDDSYIKGFIRGKIINSSIDEFVSWEAGLLVNTGIPSHGKSEFMDFLFAKLNTMYGWKVMYYSPENYPIPLHYQKIAKKLVGKKINMESPEYESTKDYINENFSWIYYERNTLEIILQTAKKYLIEDDIKILAIDPYNMVDSSKLSDENEVNYTNNFLTLLSKFAKRHNILVALTAHPTKIGKVKETRKHQTPTMYSISGSAHFYNIPEYGIVVHRQEDEDGNFLENTEVYIEKVRFGHLGKRGMSEYAYNSQNGRYSNLVNDTPMHDNSNWLEGLEEK